MAIYDTITPREWNILRELYLAEKAGIPPLFNPIFCEHLLEIHAIEADAPDGELHLAPLGKELLNTNVTSTINNRQQTKFMGGYR